MTTRIVRRLATAVVVVLALLLRPDRPQAQARFVTGAPDLATLMNNARRDIDKFWAGKLLNYRPPVDVVRIQAPAMTDCGPVSGPNAFYCPATHKIYWDTTLFATQYQLGDFAPVFILAHEWGHLVQRQLGLLDTSAGLLSIQQELQADCMAGWYAYDAAQRKVLDPGDDDEAVLSLRRAGDRLDSPWFDADAHGSPGLRIDAFTYGFEGRGCTTDAFWAFLRQRGVDPTRAPQPPAPDTGRLDQLLPAMVGRFGRFKLEDVKRVQVEGATDALLARYRAVNDPGPHLEVTVVSYPTPERARRQLEFEVKELIGKELRQIRRTSLVAKSNQSLEVGMEVVLQGQLDYIVRANRNVLGIVEGPHNLATEFSLALPF